MFEEGLVKFCHLAAGGTIDEDAVEDVHADDLVAQVVDIAWSRLLQLFAIVAEVDAFA